MATDPRPIGEKLRSIDEHAGRPMQANEGAERPPQQRPREEPKPPRQVEHKKPDDVPPRGTGRK